jgi:deoxyribodipyrimidine photo-lyase
MILHWLRRDLRVDDNVALAAACRNDTPVVGVFCCDRRWFPAQTGQTGVHQATFLLAALSELATNLARLNIPLKFRVTDDPVQTLLALAAELRATSIVFNKEYEPAQLKQDSRLMREAARIGLPVNGFKDGAIFEENEILSSSGKPYTVFSPYRRSWLTRLGMNPLNMARPPRARSVIPTQPDPIPEPTVFGFSAVNLVQAPGERAAIQRLNTFARQSIIEYESQRNFPAVEGTSRLSPHLSAGTVSIRRCVNAALDQGAGQGVHGAGVWLTELIWRDFYRMILFHFPHTENQAFDQKYATLEWSSDPELRDTWIHGRTGYPIVDAAILQVRETGWMHNRLRMIVAMFLTKDLDVHWRFGERQFRFWLMDYDQASNVGGWQWSAGTGTDAAPYFRVLNPILQGQRYDPNGRFVRLYLPALRRVPDRFVHAPWLMPSALQSTTGCLIGRDYPAPVVDHATARRQAIEKFRRRSSR